MAAKATIKVVAGVLEHEGLVLVQERPAGKDREFLWEFPGGKLRKFETPEKALIRELEEELGINTLESCLAPITFASHDYGDFHLILLCLYLNFTKKRTLRNIMRNLADLKRILTNSNIFKANPCEFK